MQVMTQDDIERIHAATLEVLGATGVWFHDNPEAIALFEQHGCQVDGWRVRFPRGIVEECLARLPDREGLLFCLPHLGWPRDFSMKQGCSQVALIGNAFYLYDYAQRSYRNCVEADLDDKFLVLDNLRNIEGDCCNLVFQSERMGGAAPASYRTVADCMAYIRRHAQERVGVRNRKARQGRWVPWRGLTRPAEESRLEVLVLLALQGRRMTEELLGRRAGFVWCNPVSPLQYHPNESASIMRVAREASPRRFIMLSPEVMIGATGPVTMAGSLVQHNAEVLAGTVLAQLAQPGAPVIYGCVSAAMDLRSAEISQGNYETALFNAAAVQLADRYGLPSRIASGNTSDRKPSARAAAEMVFGLYMGLAAGANFITTGLLDSTLMISYEHLVLLDEMVDHLRKVIGGIRTDDLAADLAEIAQHGHPSPGFVSSERTLQEMKRDIYYSDYMGRTAKSYEEWYDRAHRRVQEILSARTALVALDQDTEGRLAALESRLQQDNQTWRTGTGDWWAFYAQDLA